MSWVRDTDVGESKAKISYTCPICEDAEEKTISVPLMGDELIKCSHCHYEYFLFPTVDFDGNHTSDMDYDIEEEIEIQMESVNKVHHIVESQPEKTIQVSHTPLSAIGAILAVLFAYLSLSFIAFGLPNMISESIPIMIAFYGTAMALFIGIFSSLFGPVGSVYNGYKAYHRFSPDYSFTYFVYYTSNYFHTEPITV